MSGGDDPVGYRRPPAQHRFRKGQSGNPQGRPRRGQAPPVIMATTTQAEEALLREATRKITLVDNGSEIQLTLFEAIARRLALSGVKGDEVEGLG